MTNVVTSNKFGLMTHDVLAGLASHGVTRSLDDCELAEVQYGEVILGELTSEEEQLFLAYFDAADEAQKLSRKISASIIHCVGDAVANGEEKSLNEQLAANGGMDVPEAEATAYFRAERLREHLFAALSWNVCNRFQIFDHIIGFRTRGRVVKGRRKW